MAECLVALACVQLLALDVWVAAAPGPIDRHWGVAGAVTGWVLVAALLLAVPGLVRTVADIGGGNLAVGVPFVMALSVAAWWSPDRPAQAGTGPSCLVDGVRTSVTSGRALVVAAAVVPVVLDLANPSAATARTAWLGGLLVIGLLALPVAELMEALPPTSAASAGRRVRRLSAGVATAASVLGLVVSVVA